LEVELEADHVGEWTEKSKEIRPYYRWHTNTKGR
jgi:hypothetical protein